MTPDNDLLIRLAGVIGFVVGAVLGSSIHVVWWAYLPIGVIAILWAWWLYQRALQRARARRQQP